MKRTALFLCCLLSVASPATARAPLMNLTVDHGTPLNLSAAAASVFIANPEIADVQLMSPTQVMIFGKRTGETTFMATDSQGHTLAERIVNVTQDLAELRTELDAAIPGNHISVKPVPNGIILTGEAKDAAAVADAYKIAMRFMPTGGDIINRVQVNGSNQIQIRVRFAEVQRNIDNTLGFNWQNLGSIGGYSLGLGTGNLVNTGLGASASASQLAGNTGTTLFPRPNNSTLNSPNDVLGFGHQGKRFNVNGMIDALAQDGLITILAEPNLTAMSGETANFLAGGEFPVPIPQGNNTISITYKPYGVSLSFTPTLVGNNRINLHVRPEVSELTQTGAIVIDNISVPALTTRKAETTVEVASGESFAIAGLLDNQQSQIVNKFPLLGDMPVLGALFRSDHFQNGQTELVVIITPYIVRPTPQRLTLPTDGLAPPNENERLIGLQTTSSDPNARPQSGDPTAVIATPVTSATPMAAPVAAPVAAVTTLPASMPARIAPLAPTATVPLAPALAAPSPVEKVPPQAAPATSVPVVLHSASDGKERNGGLIVE